MAEIKAVTVTKGVTVSVGKFESIRIDAVAEIRGEGEDPDDMFKMGYDIVDEQINKQLGDIQNVVADTSVFKSDKKQSARKRR